jgi:hypothetical protein
VTLATPWINAEYENSGVVQVVPTITQFAQLPRATRGIITWIENENDGLTSQRGEFDGLSFLIRKREIRSRRPGRKRIGEEPREHGLLFTQPL